MRTHAADPNAFRDDPRLPADKVVTPSVGRLPGEASGPGLDRDTLLSLQSTIGNAGVARLMRTRAGASGTRAAGPAVVAQRESAEDEEEESDPIDKGIEAVGEAVGERIESATRLKKFGVETDTAASESLEEMAADIESVNEALAKGEEYLKYVNNAVKYYDEWGIGPPLGPAVDGLEKITVGVSAGLGKWKGRVEWGAKGAILVGALYEHYRSTSKLSFDNRASIEAWIAASKRLYDASTPFAQSIIDYLAKAGIKGSAAAAQLTLVGFYVGVMFKLAIEGVEAGTRAMEPAFKRMRRYERAIEGVVPPPAPRLPAPWMSRAEESRRAAGIERRKVEDRATRERERLAEEEEAAKKTFAASAFTGTYRAQRGWLKARILDAIRGPMGALGHTWWNCFMVGGPDVYDQARGENIHGVLEDPDDADIEAEIELFMTVEPSCPFFTQLFDRAFARYREGVGKGLIPAGR